MLTIHGWLSRAHFQLYFFKSRQKLLYKTNGKQARLEGDFQIDIQDEKKSILRYCTPLKITVLVGGNSNNGNFEGFLLLTMHYLGWFHIIWLVATQIFFIFALKHGEMIQFDEHIFQMGWDPQLVKMSSNKDYFEKEFIFQAS